MPEFFYHGYLIDGRVKDDEWSAAKWVAEIYEGQNLVFRFRLIVDRILVVAAGRENQGAYLQDEGLRRVHARLDFGEFAIGQTYDHTLTQSGEEISDPFAEKHRDIFNSQDERLSYHILRVMRRLQYESPGGMFSSDFDLSGWAYYLNVSEEDFIPVLRRLEDMGALKVFWMPSPAVAGAYTTGGQLQSKARGLQLLEDMESEFAQRVRSSVMPDLEEDAFQIARVMYDGKFVGANLVGVADLMQMVGLLDEDFKAADSFLLGAGYCDGTGGGDAGRRWLKPDGIAFVKSKQAQRVELSLSAEKLAKFLVDQFSRGKSFVGATDIKAAIGLEQAQYLNIGQELIDEGMAEEKPHADNIRLAGLAITDAGRRIVRKNFRRGTPLAAIVGGDFVQGDKVERDKISVSDVGNGSAVAAGAGATATVGISGPEAAKFFDTVFQQIEKNARLSEAERHEARETVELIQAEAEKGDKASEKALNYYFRILGKMAPDILEVAIAAASNPLLAVAVIAKKVAEKAKQEASGTG